MNEHIDIFFATANKATRNDPLAHLATQTMSIGYHASMLWQYNYQLAMAQAMGPCYLQEEQIRAMKQDRIKHTVLLGIECLGLIAAGICSLQEQR